jgi:hypothetical protein
MPDTHRFPYVPFQNARGELLLRPMLPISLTHQNRSIQDSGLLDTGADVNVLPYRLGLELGVVWEAQRVLAGLSGNLAQAEARGVILTARIGRLQPVQLAFAWTRAETVPLILGQVNFFIEFDVCFFRSESAFEISQKSGSIIG